MQGGFGRLTSSNKYILMKFTLNSINLSTYPVRIIDDEIGDKKNFNIEKTKGFQIYHFYLPQTDASNMVAINNICFDPLKLKGENALSWMGGFFFKRFLNAGLPAYSLRESKL